jgi:hypothetical protein
MKRMQTQAAMTDAAIQRLGRDLDKLGNRNQVTQLSNTERQMRSVRTEGDRLTDTFRRMDRESGGTTRALRNIGRETGNTRTHFRNATTEGNRFVTMLGRIGAATKGLGSLLMGLKIPVMIAGIGYLVQLVSSLAGGVVTLLPRIAQLGGAVTAVTGAFAAMGLAMVTVKLAFNDVGKALGGNKNALKELTPQARAFVKVLKEYQPLLKSIRAEAQKGLFPGLTAGLARSARAAPLARNLVRREGNAIGTGVAGQIERFTTDQGLANLGTIGGEGIAITRQLIPALGNLAAGLIQVTIAARPFTMWVVGIFVAFTKWFNVTMRLNRESGKTQAWLGKTRQSLILFGHILLNVYETFKNIGHASSDTGDSLWRSAARATEGWKRFTSSLGGQVEMRRFFESTRDTVTATMHLVSALAGAVYRMGQQPGIASTLDHLTAAVPDIEKTLNTFVATFIPAVIDLLAQVVRLLQLITAATGPINIVLKLLAGILRLFNNLVNSSRVLRSALMTAFSIVTIGLFIRRIQAATLAMLGLSRATGAVALASGAGGATGAATSAAGGAAAVEAGVAGGVAGRFLGGGGLRGVPRAVATGYRAGGLRGVGAALGLGVGGRAALGAAGRFAWPVALALGGYGALTAKSDPGFFNQVGTRSAGALHALSFGAFPSLQTGGMANDAAVQAVLSGGTVSGVGGHLDLNPFHHPFAPGNKIYGGQTVTGMNLNQRLQNLGGDNPTNLGQVRGQIAAMQHAVRQLGGINSAAAASTAQGLRNEIALRQQVVKSTEEQQAATRRAHAVETAHRLLPQFGREFNYIAQRRGVVAAGQQTAGDILARMNKLPESGRGIIAHAALVWAQEAARQNPKLKGMYDQLHDGVLKSFESMHDHVAIFNNKILTGTKSQWQQIQAAIVNPANRAKELVHDQFIAIQREALVALQLMGYTKQNAYTLIQSMEPGSVIPSAGVTPGAMGYKNAVNARRAMGGRLGGSGLFDTIPLHGTNAVAAPGELVVNRHTEARVNGLLGGSTTLGNEVSKETHAHFATGGRMSYPVLGGSGVATALSMASGGAIARGALQKIALIASLTGGPGGGGEVSTTGLVGQVLRALAFARQHGWQGSVTSGFRSYAEQAALYARYLAGGNIAARPGLSSHERGQAVDVSDIMGFRRAMAMAPPGSRLYSNVPGDPVHFSVSGRAYGGRLGWGGWHRNGFDGTVRTPTLFGAGEGGPEHVTITKNGGGGGSSMTINNLVIHHDAPGSTYRQAMAEFRKAWVDFSNEISYAGAEI